MNKEVFLKYQELAAVSSEVRSHEEEVKLLVKLDLLIFLGKLGIGPLKVK